MTISGGTIDNTSGSAVTLAPTIAQNWNGDFTFLGLAGGTHDLNLGSGAVTLGAARQVTVTAGNLTAGGAIGGAYKLTKAGAGTLTLSGPNTYSGGTAVSAGTLTLSGANTAGQGPVTVAGSGPNAVLNIPTGGSLIVNDPSTSAQGLLVGSGGNANGAVNITGGSLSVTGVAFEQNLNFGVCANSSYTGYGYLGMTGGTLSTINLYFGGTSTEGSTVNTGVGLISGGTATATNFLLMSRLASQISCLTIATGGTLDHFPSPGVPAGNNLEIAFGGGRSELNLTGGLLDSTGTSLEYNHAGSGTYPGIVNLNSGTLVVNSIIRTGGSAYLDFNGGTLKAGSGSATFIPSSMTAVNVYSGGATINDGGYAITAAAPLVAPGNTGVTAIAATTQGAGYIGAPYVSITGGTLASGGAPATAIANMVSDGTGNGTYAVGSITITCPGVYSAAPTGVTFTGGGPTTAAVAGTITTAANTSGGLTKLGAGTLTLSAVNTYTGATAVPTGTLTLSGSGTLGSSAPLTMSGGTLDLGALTTPAVGAVNITAAASSGNTIQNGSLTGSSYAASLTSGNAAVTANLLGSGGLTLNGNGGTLTLSGVNTFSGATAINAGELVGVVNGSCANSAVSVAATSGNTAVLSISDNNTAKQWTCSSLTVNNSGTSSGLDFNFGSLTPTTVEAAPLNVSGNVTLTTAPAITVEYTGTLLAGSYPLMTWGSGSPVTNGMTVNLTPALNARSSASLNISGKTLYLVVSSTEPLTWQPAAGTWNTSAQNWRDNLGNLTAYIDGSPGDTVLFNDTPGSGPVAVTLTSSYQPASVTVNDTNASYTISGSGGIAGSSTSLTKNGSGTLTLATANTYAGATAINAGTVTLSGSGTLGSGSAVTLGGGKLDLGALTPPTVGAVSITAAASSGNTITNGSLTGTAYAGSLTSGNAVISANLLADGSAGLTMNGAGGTLTLAGNNTYTGPTAINAGTVAVSGSGTLGAATAPLTLGGGTLDLGASSGTVGAVSITAAAGSGNTIQNGSLTGSSYAASLPSGTATVSANLLGTGSLAMSGAGTLLLSGNNTYNGGTTISAGTVRAGSATALNSAGTLTMSGTGTLDLNGYNLTNSNLSAMASGNSITTTGAGSGTDTLTVTALTPTGGLPGLFTNGPTRALALNLTSSGAAIPATTNPNNTYSGGLILGSNMRISPLAASATTGSPGAITSGPFGTGSLTINTSAQIYFSSANLTLVNAVIVNANNGNGSRNGAFRVDTTGNTISGAITANGADALFYAGTASGAVTLTGPVVGAYGLSISTYNGSYTEAVTLDNTTANPNSYSGTTTVGSSTSTLVMGAANQIPNGTGKGNVTLAGTLNLAGFNQSINGLTGAGIVDGVSGSPVFTIGGGNATSNTFSGVIQNSGGSLSLVKTGSGIQTLSGTNTYNGNTTISGGTLALSGSGSISNSAQIAIAAGAAFDVSAYAAYTWSSNTTLSAAGTITPATINGKAGGTVSLGTNAIKLTYDGTHPALTVSNATLMLNGNPFTVNGTPLAAGSYLIAQQPGGSITSSGVYPAVVGAAIDSLHSATISVSGGNVNLVVENTTTLGLASSAQTNGYLAPLIFTATVQTNNVLAGNASGSVTFFYTNLLTGLTPVSFSTNSIVGGGSVTSLSIANLPRGTNWITAAYSGDSTYPPCGSSIWQIITNHPPVAGVMTVTRIAGLAFMIPLSNLATNWSDADGDTVELAGVNLPSTNGVNLIALNWTTNLDGSIATTNPVAYIGYTNSPNVKDQISYSISDGQGGTNIGYVNIVIQSSVAGTNSITTYNFTNPHSNTIAAYGIPGYFYILERATNLSSPVWVDLQTNQAATNGIINAADTFWDLVGSKPSPAFYQLKWQP